MTTLAGIVLGGYKFSHKQLKIYCEGVGPIMEITKIDWGMKVAKTPFRGTSRTVLGWVLGDVEYSLKTTIERTAYESLRKQLAKNVWTDKFHWNIQFVRGAGASTPGGGGVMFDLSYGLDTSGLISDGQSSEENVQIHTVDLEWAVNLRTRDDGSGPIVEGILTSGDSAEVAAQVLGLVA